MIVSVLLFNAVFLLSGVATFGFGRWKPLARITARRVTSPEAQTEAPWFVKFDENNSYSSAMGKDMDLLSTVLTDCVRRENPQVSSVYDALSAEAIARAKGDKEALQRMVAYVSKISSEDIYGATRAFSQTLNFANAAEAHDRMRILRDGIKRTNDASPLPQIEDSVGGTVTRILSGDEKAYDGDATDLEGRKNDIYNALLAQKVEIVFTAHPTEVNRRTLLSKYRRVSEGLETLDRQDLSPYERRNAFEDLRREVISIWGSDEIRRNKPTPQMEAKGGTAIIESVLWDAVPAYLRRLNAQCIESLGRSLPIDHAPLVFASWMGGDRDGNPNVTPEVTHEVAMSQRLQATGLLSKEAAHVYNELAVCKGFSDEMVNMAAEVKDSKDRFELYRRVLGHMEKRLEATARWCEMELETPGAGSAMLDSTTAEEYPTVGHADQPYVDVSELMNPLRIMHESLVSSGFADVADGALIDLIRRIAVFGLTLVPLDLRQESGRHEEAINAITEHLGIGEYKSWSEDEKIAWLQKELAGKRPLFRTRDIEKLGFSPTVVDTLKTIFTVSKFPPGSLGAYVISQATSASDVLEVMLLQKQFDMTPENGNMMRVVPLFETLTDLTNAPEVMDKLFSLPNYLDSVKQKHEVMIGYSDSAKDAGRLAACWIQYKSQELMVGVAGKYGVDLTFFHGKGGTVGRGGNPALYRAVIAHPPKTINGKFRVTEQGEMITQNFGSCSIAERTMDIYTAAVLAEKFCKHIKVLPEWRNEMERLSEISCEAYRTLVFKEPTFIKYFRTATPELELGRLNIGSRPAKRNPKGGIESLRAIPWTFAWTQTRLNLPAWYGVGDAFDTSKDSERLSELRNMYSEWPFFREMINLIAMTLSKADSNVAKNYDLQLIAADDDVSQTLGHNIRVKLRATMENILKITESQDLSCGFEFLHQVMIDRYPYIDPLNVLQAELLKRLRMAEAAVDSTGSSDVDDEDKEASQKDQERERQILADTLILSINGIAQGMKNSG